MERRARWLAAAISAGLCLFATAVAIASETRSDEGGPSVANAAEIGLNRPIRGRMIDGALVSGYSAAYYTVRLLRGDRVTIRTRALAGDTAPCQSLFLPGTTDEDVQSPEREQHLLAPTSQERDGTRDVQTWTPARSGIYVLVMNNLILDALDCLAAGPRWAYTFTATAPHLLRLGFRSAPKTLTAGKEATFVVSGSNSRSRPVSGLRLAVTGTRNGHRVLKPVTATLANGRATITLAVPAGLKGKKVRISTSGGGGRTWVRARASRTYLVR